MGHLDPRLTRLAGPPDGSTAYVLLDVFTERALAGNPLAVFTDGRGLAAATMQAAARELNLAESVFLLDPSDAAEARARIFTPVAELPFAGHPLLGTGILLAEALALDRVTIETAAGPVPVEILARGAAPRARMEQPLPERRPFDRERELLAALGVGHAALPITLYVNGPQHVLVGLDDAASVRSLAPDLGALAGLGEFAVSCFAREQEGWLTRMFAPALGVPEDPATGSAAGPIAVHACRGGLTSYGSWLQIRQGEQIGRPSELWALAEGSDQKLERVLVAGHALRVGAGALLLPAATSAAGER